MTVSNNTIQGIIKYGKTLKIVETGIMNDIDFPKWKCNFNKSNLN